MYMDFPYNVFCIFRMYKGITHWKDIWLVFLNAMNIQNNNINMHLAFHLALIFTVLKYIGILTNVRISVASNISYQFKTRMNKSHIYMAFLIYSSKHTNVNRNTISKKHVPDHS